MSTLEIAIAKIKKLPVEQRNELLEFIELLEFKIGKISQIQEQIQTDELPYTRQTRCTKIFCYGEVRSH